MRISDWSSDVCSSDPDTEERNAVMFFVALGERYVEVIADRGLQERIGASEVWNAIVADFVAAVREGRPDDGSVHAIAKCSSLMAEHFPDRAGAANRLPAHLLPSKDSSVGTQWIHTI